jgi:DNA-binding response OmpR family regulator
MSRILVVEDEPRIAAFLEKGLTASGWSTTISSTGREGLQRARTEDFDLLILDLGLPDIDGLEVLAELRRGDSRVPVVIVTARDDLTNTVAGLDAGADDYIVKPFSFEELLARVRLRLREAQSPDQTTLKAGGAELDLRRRQAIVDGETVDLTAREFALAEVFFRHPGQVFSREHLLSHVWSDAHRPRSNVVDVYVGYLRKKLGKERIANRRGLGYSLDPAARPGRRRRVLMIEDEARTAHIVVRGLAQDGHAVVVAENGEVGLFLAGTEEFDLVLLDIDLPGVSGLGVLGELTDERPTLPVVVLTAHGDDDVRRRCSEAGADVLAKPLVLGELRKVVRARLAV